MIARIGGNFEQRRHNETSEVNGLPLDHVHDARVIEFCCHDDSFVQSLATDERHASWRVQVKGLSDPIFIQLCADAKQAGVKVNGHQVLPAKETSHKGTLAEDFKHEWPSILGDYHGLHECNAFEVQPGQGCHVFAGIGCEADPWYPATLMHIREDGDYDVVATVRSVLEGESSNEKEVVFPALGSQQIRIKDKHTPPQRQHHSLVMVVPKQNPRRLGLWFDGAPITQLLCRETPPGTHHHSYNGQFHHHHTGHLGHAGHSHEASVPRIRLVVNKMRTVVTSNIGHAYLGQFLTCEPRNVSQKSERLQKTWKLQIGPFAEHTIVLEKRFVSTDIVTLSVDDEYLVEATQKDLDAYSEILQKSGERIPKHLRILGAVGTNAARINGEYSLKGLHDGHPAWQNANDVDLWLLRLGSTGKWIVTSERNGHNAREGTPSSLLTTDEAREFPTEVSQWSDGHAHVDTAENDPYWQCEFCFVNERILEYEVFEEYRTGETLDTKGIVSKRLRSTIVCSVTLPEELGLADATLKVNGRDFEELRFWHEKHQELKEIGLQTTPETLKLQYDLMVPHRISEAASKGSMARWAHGALAPLGLESFLAECQDWCKKPSISVQWCRNMEISDFQGMVAPIMAAASSMCTGEAEKKEHDEHAQSDPGNSIVQSNRRNSPAQEEHERTAKALDDTKHNNRHDNLVLDIDNAKHDNGKPLVPALSLSNKKKTARPKLQFA